MLNQEITISKQEYEELLKLKAKKQKRREVHNKNFNKKKLKKAQIKKKEELKKEQMRELANNRASELRSNSTESEKKFKIYLKLLGIKYAFQYPIYPEKSFFIVDFFLPKERLIIEIDGGYHKDRKQEAKDKLRDKVLLEQCGFKTIRIKNEDVDKGELYIKQLLGVHIKL